MGNQPYELNPTGRERTGSNRPPTIANLPAVPVPVTGAPRPAAGSHQCPNCGAWAPAGSSICAECGVRIQPKPQKIRCRLCGTTAPASLVICPSCGRELQPAPSRILSWGAPAVLVLLFLLVLVQRWESGNPLRWLQTEFATGREWVDQMAQQLDPQITISTLPASVAENQPLDSATALPAENQTNFVAAPLSNTDTVDQSSTVTASDSSTGAPNTQEQPATTNQTTTAAPAESAVVTPTVIVVTPTAVATAEPVAQPTATTAPPEPTATPTSLPSATATLRQTTVSAIVQALPVVTTPDTITAASITTTTTDANARTILQPTPTIPLPTPTLPPPTPTATASAITYVVQAGDTPLDIANKFDITVNELLATNGMSIEDARRLRVGQVLTIAAAAAPVPTPTPTLTPTTPSATATVSPTPTSVTPTATSTPASTVRVDAPVLRSPENGSYLSCTTNNTLIWLPVAFIRESDQYLLHLGFLSGYNGDGSEQVTWVLEQWRPANVTLWDLDRGLCGLAPQAFGRQWRWYVEVVEANGSGWQAVSPPSAIGQFSWN